MACYRYGKGEGETERMVAQEFIARYRFLRPIIKEVVERYLDCGNPRCGICRSVFVKSAIRLVDRAAVPGAASLWLRACPGFWVRGCTFPPYLLTVWNNKEKNAAANINRIAIVIACSPRISLTDGPNAISAKNPATTVIASKLARCQYPPPK